jgi:hypothetical protein
MTRPHDCLSGNAAGSEIVSDFYCMIMQRSPRARSVLWLHLRVRDFGLKPHSLLTCNALGCEHLACAEGTRSLKDIVLLTLKQPRPSSTS